MGLKLGLVRQNQDAEKCLLRRKSERWRWPKRDGGWPNNDICGQNVKNTGQKKMHYIILVLVHLLAEPNNCLLLRSRHCDDRDSSDVRRRLIKMFLRSLTKEFAATCFQIKMWEQHLSWYSNHKHLDKHTGRNVWGLMNKNLFGERWSLGKTRLSNSATNSAQHCGAGQSSWPLVFLLACSDLSEMADTSYGAASAAQSTPQKDRPKSKTADIIVDYVTYYHPYPSTPNASNVWRYFRCKRGVIPNLLGVLCAL